MLLTAYYPYDDHEAVLGPEIAILAKSFDRVVLAPSNRGERVGRPPARNVELRELPWFGPWDRGQKLRALASLQALRVLVETVRRPVRWAAYRRNWRFYLDLLAINLLKTSVLANFVHEQGLEHAVFYDFWFENSTLSLALLRRSKAIGTAVARAHNFDIYDEDWAQGAVPFSEFKARHLDRVFPVSQHGDHYLRSRLPFLRTEVARLGVPAQDPAPIPLPDIPLIVSCAWLHPRKRIHLIPEVLDALPGPMHWIHFGDGIDRSRVEAAAARLRDDVTWELRGRVANSEVLEFYRRCRVSAFLSLSLSEGVPVAMMEAQSFGIPIVAVNVRGIPDIVTPETGILIDPDEPPVEVARALGKVLYNDRFNRSTILSFFLEHFEATMNYEAFAAAIVRLRSDL